MKKRFAIMLVVFMWALFVPILESKAAFQVSVQTVIPENQLTPQHSFFNLLLEPGEFQTLEVLLSNPTPEDIIVSVEIGPATTNQNGVVEYGPRDIERDSTLLHSMDELVEAPREILVPANGTATLQLNVQMPVEPVEGVIAGGITLTEQEAETDDEAGGGFTIEHRFAMVTAILLRNSEADIVPELILNDVFPDQQNRRSMILANLQNTSPTFINQVMVEATVTDVASGFQVLETTRQQMQFAPNSNMYFPLRLEGQPLEAGNFLLSMTVTSGENTWEFEREFQILAETADDLNANDVLIVPTERNWTWIWVSVGVAVLVITNILTVVYFKRKAQK